jgi:hypothetical protein
MGMDKASRRKKRKADKAKWDRGIVLGAAKTLKNCYMARQVLDRLIAEALIKYPSLLKVVELEGEFVSLQGSELLEHLHLGQYEERRTVGSTDDGYADLSGDGGEMLFLSGPDGRIRTLVVIRYRAGTAVSADGMSQGDQHNLAVFLHELGHVDDFTRGGLGPDREVDQGKAELHAHLYACRTMVRNRLPVTLGFYLDVMVEQQFALGVASCRWAAQELRSSPEYEGYRKFAGLPPTGEPAKVAPVA